MARLEIEPRLRTNGCLLLLAALSLLALAAGAVPPWAGCGVAVLAYVVARIASAPLKSLSVSAVELGMDLDHEPLRVARPTEVKRAAEAFNAMQRWLQEHVGEPFRERSAVDADESAAASRRTRRPAEPASVAGGSQRPGQPAPAGRQ